MMNEKILKIPAKEVENLLTKTKEIFDLQETLIEKNKKLKEQNEWLASFAVHMEKQRNIFLEKYTKLKDKDEENC